MHQFLPFSLRTPFFSALALCALACGHAEESHQQTEEAPVPGLSVESPGVADWLPAGATSVSGTATGVTSVDVNGTVAVLGEDGRFVATVDLERGIHLLEVTAHEPDGDSLFDRRGVISGDFANPGRIEDAVHLRLNEGGLDLLVDLAADVVEDLDINSLLGEVNPIYEDTYGVWGWDAVEVAADVDSIVFDAPSLRVTPRDGELELGVTIPNLDVDVIAYGEAVGIDFDVDIEVTADYAKIEATVKIDAAHGSLEVELTEADIELIGFAYDTSVLPDAVESALLVGTIRDTIEEKILEAVTEAVPPLLDEQLSSLDPSYTAELLDLKFTVDARFAEASIDVRGLALTLDLDIDIQSDGDKTYAGVLVSDTGSAEPDIRSDLALALSDDLMNRILFEAWRAGAMELTLSTEDGTLDENLLAMLQADEGSIHVWTELPPVLVERDGELQLQAAEVMIEILTPGGEKGESLTVSAAVFADVSLSISSSTLYPELGEVEVLVMVRDSDWGASEEAITNVLEAALPIQTMVAPAANLAFDLPTIYGLQIWGAEVERAESGVHTDITVDLSLE
jgi:hypothetical protein